MATVTPMNICKSPIIHTADYVLLKLLIHIDYILRMSDCFCEFLYSSHSKLIRCFSCLFTGWV